MYRPLTDATRADLIGRSVWTLTNPSDGFGDATVSLARIWTGRMHAHAHRPGGEFMYVAAGGGRVWIEGIPLQLTRHGAAFIPPGLLHNAENTRADDLLIVGITAPGVVPGSYAEVPPILRATGRLASVQGLACDRTVETTGVAGPDVVRLDPPPGSFPLVIRALTIGSSGADRTSDSTRVWVGVGGRGAVTTGGRARARSMAGFATVVASARTPVTFRGDRRGLRLLELSVPS